MKNLTFVDYIGLILLVGFLIFAHSVTSPYFHTPISQVPLGIFAIKLAHQAIITFFFIFGGYICVFKRFKN